MNISWTMRGVPRMNSMYATASHLSGRILPMRMVAISVPRIVPSRTENAAMMSVLTTPCAKKLE